MMDWYQCWFVLTVCILNSNQNEFTEFLMHSGYEFKNITGYWSRSFTSKCNCQYLHCNKIMHLTFKCYIFPIYLFAGFPLPILSFVHFQLAFKFKISNFKLFLHPHKKVFIIKSRPNWNVLHFYIVVNWKCPLK